MTPEQTALLAEAVERVITAEEIEETLPLTQGDGSVYRKDETGNVSHTKVITGAEHARVTFKMSMPQLSSPDFKAFMAAAKNIMKNGTIYVAAYSDSDIEKVNTGGITGSIANEMIKRKYGEK